MPSWRPDSTAEVDVVEEVARHVGYANLGMAVPNSTTHGRLSSRQHRRRLLRDVLVGLGISEAITESFLSDAVLASAGLPLDVIRITNPLVVGEDVLRPSMRPGLLNAIAFNESHRRLGVCLFEVGHVYPPGDRSTELPPEYEGLAVVLAGRDATHAIVLWRELAHALGFGARVDQSLVPVGLHPSRSATLSIGREVVGAVGEIHPSVLASFGVSERVAWLELDLTRLLANDAKIALWKPTSRYPSSDFDLAFVLADTVPAEKLEKVIRQAAGNLLVDLALFDSYRGSGVADGSRSLAYRLRLQALDHTLADAEVVAVREKIVTVAAKLGARLRA